MISFKDIELKDKELITSYTPVSYTHLDVYKRQGCKVMVIKCGVADTMPTALMEQTDNTFS